MHANIPVRQNDFRIQPLRNGYPGLIGIRSQVHQVGDHMRHPGTIQSTFGQDATDNRILIALGDVPAGDDHVVQEQARIRAVLPWVG